MSTNFESKIISALDSIESISLKEMDNVKLMRRTDVKYVFHVRELADILKTVAPAYKVLEIKGSKVQPYETMYFDTDEDEMYHLHQCGRANRHKVRVREYMNSRMRFLEVKNKNNKGETIKSRIKYFEDYSKMGETEEAFLKKVTPYSLDDLRPRLNNRFTRLMLVSKHIEERITIDFNLAFLPNDQDEWEEYESLCIVEVKRNIGEKRSDFVEVLNQKKIHPMRFSKYCMGLALLNKSIKQNRFKPRLMKIKKMENTQLNS